MLLPVTTVGKTPLTELTLEWLLTCNTNSKIVMQVYFMQRGKVLRLAFKLKENEQLQCTE